LRVYVQISLFRANDDALLAFAPEDTGQSERFLAIPAQDTAFVWNSAHNPCVRLLGCYWAAARKSAFNFYVDKGMQV
jgi:hypothetical protein